MEINYETPVREVPCAAVPGHRDQPCNAVHRIHVGTGTITIAGAMAETDAVIERIVDLVTRHCLPERALSLADLSMMPTGAEVEADAHDLPAPRVRWQRQGSGLWSQPTSGALMSSKRLANFRRPTEVPS